MYIASCPLRISLFWGSTDNPDFINRYNFGSVISLTCNLKTYITLHQDIIGYNIDGGFYTINYSKREVVKEINEIKNDPVRVVLNHFQINPLNVSMTSDSYSQGSGLASSSSYIISLIKAITIMKGLNMNTIEICKLAFKLEQKFNKFCGYQDPFGCGIGGFKKIEFEKGSQIKYSFLEPKIFEHYDMHLVFSGIVRNSNEILRSVTANIETALPLLDTLEKAYYELINNNYDKFINLISQSWDQKKKTSKLILANKIIKDLDKYLSENKSVIAHKLCGAGNGGFFLIFSEKDKLQIKLRSVKINVEPNGVLGRSL